jgi:hypothetical protein
MIGLVELLKSKKATLSLIIIACSTTAMLTGHMEGGAFAATMSTVAVIYNFCQHKFDIANLQNTPDDRPPERAR